MSAVEYETVIGLEIHVQLATGSAPGRPRQTGQVWVLGGSPKLSVQPQNIFVTVASWTWISSPMTVSYSTALMPSSRCSR